MLEHEVINVDVEMNTCRLFNSGCGKDVFDVADFANRRAVHSMVPCARMEPPSCCFTLICIRSRGIPVAVQILSEMTSMD